MLSTVLVIVIALCGLWALMFTGHFFNVRQTQPTVVLMVRILFVVCLVLLLLVQIGSIGDKSLAP